MGQEDGIKAEPQMSDSIRLGIILALSGGAMDAYSYIHRGGVFANAQTGNMIRFGLFLSSGDYETALNYLFPIVAFAAGIFLADVIHMHTKEQESIHWRQTSVLIEAAVLCLVSFMPSSQDRLANALTSFGCGMQVESFRKIHGHVIATTMCIGNLRSGTEGLHRFLLTGERKYLHIAGLYYGIITCFIIGAVFGNEMVKRFHQRAILCSSVMLVLAFAMMSYRHKNIT